MKSSPLISVVMATYNGEKYLQEQLESILHQTYTPLEIIVVDDCSKDNTLKIIEEFQINYPQIKLFKSDKNLGYIKNFERGMRLATGEFIAPSDQDDIWDKRKIEVLYTHIKDEILIYCNSYLIDNKGDRTGEKLSDRKKLLTFDSPIQYAIGNTAAGHAMLLKRELVDDCGEFPTMIPHDYWLGFVSTFKNRVRFLDESLVFYRQHEDNIFGVKIKGNIRKNRKEFRENSLEKIRERVRLLWEKCPEEMKEEKYFFAKMHQTYQRFSMTNNWNRMMLFFRYRTKILAFKRRTAFRRWVFCLKMFVKII